MEEQSVPLSDTQPKMTRRLGRGLNALLGSGSDDAPRQPTIKLHAPEQDEISVELIERNPFQPRREFDQRAIDELAESIRKHGILQPLLVRSMGDDGYQLIAGERRWRACQQIGMETVPCRVVELEDRQVCEAAIEENLKRQDLNMIEKAVAFKEYLEKFGGTIEELAKQLSMNRSTISNMLRLLDLPEAVQDAVRKDLISGGHARALLPLSAEAQAEMCQQIQSQNLSVRKTEEAVRALVKGDAPAATTAKAAKPEVTPHVLSLQDGLREQYAAKVEIKLKKKDAGQVVIHFDSNDDFERIVGLLRKAG
ncbi:MAG: ParB/RepB/Spo0J family partition protein [Planctomycetaceae bacterium]|nr:ParB/RepB/Spo0J family partition protein [Planctomycetaceae bacterium]